MATPNKIVPHWDEFFKTRRLAFPFTFKTTSRIGWWIGWGSTHVLFISSRALSSWLGVIHVNHSSELFIASKALSPWPGVVHVIYNSKLLIAFKVQTSWLRVFNFIHNPEFLIAFGLIGSWPRIIDMILSLELFIASGDLRPRDIESFIYPKLWVVHSI